jgi:outer membrane protein OmpA-like peptidoglycan-associated protein
MVANPEVSVVITGHTDNVGSQKYNQALSLKRAQSVKNWLVEKGIASKRMRTVGRGMNEPIASNDTEEGRLQNRRMEFYVEK